MKHPAASARDKWFESAEGKRATEGSAEGQYLRNRVERAFLAGWDAAIDHEIKKEIAFRSQNKTK